MDTSKGSLTGSQRQAAFKDRMRSAGLVRVEVWVDKSKVDRIKAMACGALEFGFIEEKAAIEAMQSLSMEGIELNKAGAIDLCHGFLLVRERILRELSSYPKVGGDTCQKHDTVALDRHET